MKKKYIKPSEYGKMYSLNYRTVVRHFQEGKIKGFQDKKTGTIYLENPFYKEEDDRNYDKVFLYARVSSSTNKKSLDGQIERMRSYASAKGWQIVGEEKEIASGLNENRRKLNKILDQSDYDILLVEHKDRLTRFGFEYIQRILNGRKQKIEVINKTENKNGEIVNDFVSIITSFCAKLYTSNRKAKTKKIIKELIEDGKER